MEEILEIRLPTEWVTKHIGIGYGTKISHMTTKVILPIQHSDVAHIHELIDQYSRETDYYHFTYLKRKYSKQELNFAEILRLMIKTAFEPAAEECGTIYDYINACQHCGSGRVQKTPLKLDTSRLLAGKDFAKTIADEWVCSRGLYNLIKEHSLTGIDFAPVFGCDGKRENYKWLQMVINGSAGRMAKGSDFGIDYFNRDEEGRYICPDKHVSGLNILSEVYINKDEWDGSDISVTSDMIGLRQGLLVPYPIIIISRRFYQLMKQQKVTGYDVEVAHLV